MDSSSPSLPSPSPPPSTRPAPFDRLPFEVVQEIINLTVPIHYHSETYRKRQDILLSLSLVSRLFRQIAQPLLLSVVKLNLSHKVEACSSWKPNYLGRNLCREMAINVWVSEGNQIVKEIVTAEISLKVLVAHNCQMLDFAELSGAPNLSAIRLRRTTLSASKTIRLPQLVELSLHQVASIDSFGNNVNDLSFPALRAFSAQSSIPNRVVFDPSVILTTRAPFEIVSLDVVVAATLHESIVERLQSKILIDHHRLELPLVDRFKNFRLHDNGSTSCALSSLIEKISESSPSHLPSLIYLSREPAHDIIVEVFSCLGYYKETEQAYQKLFEICEQRGIEVVTCEDSIGRELVDRGFLQDFWRRNKATGTVDSAEGGARVTSG